MEEAYKTATPDKPEDFGKSFSQHCPHLSKGNNIVVSQRHSELLDLHVNT